MNKIELKNVSFAYDDTQIFEDFSIEIAEGEFIAIVGANGSGKTTFSRLISGILHPDSGEIFINGSQITSENNKALKNVSIVLQNPEDQFVGSSVRDDIAFGLENKQVAREEMDTIINRVAEETKIMHLLDKEPTQLSGGQKQRVAIASVLALNTGYMIFDEATSQLDPEGKMEVMEVVEEIVQYEQKTIIMVTHELGEVLRADRVLVMHEGKLVADSTPEEIFSPSFPLEDYHLQVPPILEMSQLLERKGVVSNTYLELEGLVEAICK